LVFDLPDSPAKYIFPAGEKKKKAVPLISFPGDTRKYKNVTLDLWKREYQEDLLEMSTNEYDYLAYSATCSFQVSPGGGRDEEQKRGEPGGREGNQ
jgi:hypothetical protein